APCSCGPRGRCSTRRRRGGRWDVRAHSREFVDDAHHDERHPLQRQGEGAQIHRVHQRPGICDPHVRGPGCCRVERPALRGGLHPLHTGPDPRPLPRVQLQHVRDPRPQIPVPPARGGAGQHQEPQDRLGRRAGLRGHEDDARGGDWFPLPQSVSLLIIFGEGASSEPPPPRVTWASASSAQRSCSFQCEPAADRASSEGLLPSTSRSPSRPFLLLPSLLPPSLQPPPRLRRQRWTRARFLFPPSAAVGE
ncbi:unnamed protein product, partial [Prorocentrum cordatum]